MSPLEAPKNNKIKNEITETEKQEAAFKVKDKRRDQDYEVVLDKSGNRKAFNREKRVDDLENEIRKTEKQEVVEKLSQEKSDLVKGIKELESEFKKPGNKNKKELIEKSILEKETKTREIENQLKTTEKKEEDKKEEEKETPVQKTETGTKEERKQNIEKLWQDVEKARKEYSEKDYKNNTGLTRVKNFFGAFLKKDKDGTSFQSEKELAEYQERYEKSLSIYKKAELDNTRLKGASNEELLKIAAIFQVEANLKLAEIHDQVKKENQEGKIVGFVKEHSKEWIEKYNKLSKPKKIAIGVAFSLAGAGAVYVGGATAIMVGSAVVTRRMLMGVITGTSVSWGFEAWGKKKTAEKNKAEMKNLETKMIELSEEEKIKKLEEFIDKDMGDTDQKMKKIKNKNLRHLAYGITAGTVASGVWSHFMEDVSGNVPKGSGGEQNIPEDTKNVPGGPEDVPKDISEVAKEELKTPEMEQVVVEVQKDNSLWKIIGKQLENHDGYAELNEAQKTYVIDTLKDKVAVDPSKFGLDNIDKLKIGQKIDLSEIFQDRQPDNLIIEAQNLSEEKMQSILENRPKLRREWINANPGEELTSEKTEEISKGIKETKDIPVASNFEEVSETEEIKEAPETPEKSEVEEIPKTEKTSSVEESSEVEGVEGAPKTEEVGEVPKASEEPVIENNADVNEQAKKSAEAEEPEIQFEKAAKEPEIVLSSEAAHKMIEKSVDKFGEDIVEVRWIDKTSLFGGQQEMSWNDIKDIKCSDVQLKESSIVPKYIKDRFDKIMVFSKESFGAEGIAKPNETLKDWLVRLTEKQGADKVENIFKLVK